MAAQAGVWSEDGQEWQTECITDVAIHAHSLTFRTRQLGLLALLQPGSGLLPLADWRLRPLGGPQPAAVALDLLTGAHQRLSNIAQRQSGAAACCPWLSGTCVGRGGPAAYECGLLVDQQLFHLGHHKPEESS